MLVLKTVAVQEEQSETTPGSRLAAQALICWHLSVLVYSSSISPAKVLEYEWAARGNVAIAAAVARNLSVTDSVSATSRLLPALKSEGGNYASEAQFKTWSLCH